MSSEQVIKATVWIEGEVSMGRYYVPNADMDETRKRLREAEFRLQGREGMSTDNETRLRGVLPTEIARQGGNREVAEDVLLPVFAEVIHVHLS